MDYEGCYDAVAEIVQEADAKFVGAKLNQEKFEAMHDTCKLVDELFTKVECESVDVVVDMPSRQLIITMVCDEMILENGRTDSFFTLIQRLSSFAFCKAKGEFVRVEMRIDDMWEDSN